ncbi:MAG: von Willebrand factor type A domain-containing protein, partial [Bacteroidota bacterium]
MKNYLTPLFIGWGIILLIIFPACESAYYPSLRQDEASAFRDSGIEGEQYNSIVENPFYRTDEQPVSTFSVDADGGAYSNFRRIIRSGLLPPPAAIRTEEFINYFTYDIQEPEMGEDISLRGEISSCPWATDHRLISIGIKGRSLAEIPASNLVLLIDVSGSMSSSDKLPLLKDALALLVDQFRPEDRIALVTYAGSSKVKLKSTPGDQKETILKAIRRLETGGGTGGAKGITTAYEIAEENFIPNGNNRVIMATDGDFNVGISSQEELLELIEEKRESGIFLTTIGTGSGNYQEGKMEQIANHGNGTYEYLDDLEQAEKLFVHEYAKLFTVAKDVKVQVSFNPEIIQAYRLIGYENRVLSEEDFENDSTDGGEIGAGQTIAALYEIVPQIDIASKQEPSFSIQFRYKKP